MPNQNSHMHKNDSYLKRTIVSLVTCNALNIEIYFGKPKPTATGGFMSLVFKYYILNNKTIHV